MVSGWIIFWVCIALFIAIVVILIMLEERNISTPGSFEDMADMNLEMARQRDLDRKRREYQERNEELRQRIERGRIRAEEECKGIILLSLSTFDQSRISRVKDCLREFLVINDVLIPLDHIERTELMLGSEPEVVEVHDPYEPMWWPYYHKVKGGYGTIKIRMVSGKEETFSVIWTHQQEMYNKVQEIWRKS